MTRKDFELIAKAVHDNASGKYKPTTGERNYNKGYNQAKADIAEKLAAMCLAQNPRFRRDLFLAACGVEQ